MRVQIHTDRHLEAPDEMARQFVAVVEAAMSRFGDKITRVEVHLSDVNGNKSGGDDKRCLLEARLAGLRPIAVSHQAAALALAVDGATEKLERSLDSTLGRLASRSRGGTSDRGGPAPA